MTQAILPTPILIQELNQLLRGWANYFRFGYPSDPLEIKHYLRLRLQQNQTQPAALPFAQQVSIMPDEGMKRDFQLLSTKISTGVVKDRHY